MTSSKDAATRYECMKALNTGLKEFERTAALSLNMVAGSWHAENTERGFERLRSQRNLGEFIFGYFGYFGYVLVILVILVIVSVWAIIMTSCFLYR